MKNYLIKPAVVCFILFMTSYWAKAQQTPDKSVQQYSKRLQAILRPSSLSYWLDIRQEINIKPSEFFKEYKNDLNLTGNDVFKIFKTLTDAASNRHIRYQQYFKGLRIEGAESVVHEEKGRVSGVNGRWVSNFNSNTTPALNEKQALNSALLSLKTKDYLWNRNLSKEIVDRITKNGYSVTPKGELLICRKNWNGGFDAGNMTLAWKFTLLVFPMKESSTMYIDASTGKLIHKTPVSPNCTIGSGATTWYGTRTFSTTWVGWPANNYFLDYDEGGCAYNTNIRSRRGDPIIPYDYADGDNSWQDADGVNGYNMRAGVTTYWSLVQSNSYYINTFGRNSYDNAGGWLDAYDEINGTIWCDADNASWNPVFHSLHFGAHFTSSPSDDWNCIDIVGHEMTHGVTQFAAGLEYSYESGALNESFSDIFGEMIQSYGLGVFDWLVGADRGAIRNMSNPNAFGHPDTYKGTYWYSGGDWDNGGVHLNSGVQNYWFYLLSSGGTGTNDIGRSFNVGSIGYNAAARIAYQNLEYYMLSSSQYIDAREGAIRAAAGLYGTCSNEVIQTANAWHAVGVGEEYFNDGAAICGVYSSGLSNYLFRGFDVMNLAQSCALTLQNASGGNFTIVSGKEINFYPGFTALQNSNVNIYIDPCIVSYYPLSVPVATTEAATQNKTITSKAADPGKIKDRVYLYPNPANSYVMIQSKTAIDRANCYITDISGKKLSCRWNGTLNTLDISRLNQGVYFIHLLQQGKMTSLKFLKQ